MGIQMQDLIYNIIKTSEIAISELKAAKKQFEKDAKKLEKIGKTNRINDAKLIYHAEIKKIVRKYKVIVTDRLKIIEVSAETF